MLNPDFRDMLSALNGEGAEYLVVGAYALAAHGIPRATGDLDFWIRPTPENAEKVLKALAAFGAPTSDISEEDLVAPEVVFQIGREPSRIDILTDIDGLQFDEAWDNRMETSVDGVPVFILGRDDLIANKMAVGRPRDLADVEALRSHWQMEESDDKG